MTSILVWLAQRKKAVVGFVAPGVALFVTDFVKDGGFPTTHEWEAIGVACVLTALGVHAAPKNADRPTGLD